VKGIRPAVSQPYEYRLPIVDLRTRALFLDVDGTLLEIAPDPDSVVVADRLRRLIPELTRLTAGALALVSGRTIAQLDALFRPMMLPCSGLHGLERRDVQGLVHRPAINDEKLGRARSFLAAMVQVNPGLLLENKHSTLALHYRQAPQLGPTARRLMAQALEILGADYCVLEGKMVFELKPDGFSKSTAIAAFLREPPFVRRSPIFVGDDRTDEAGLAYVENLGGLAIHVGPAHADSGASWRLPSVAAVHDWLESLLPARAPATRSES